MDLKRRGSLINRKFFSYIIPTTLTMAATSLASVIGGILVGNLLGARELAAIGLSEPIIYIMNMTFLLFSVGGTTCSAIAKGKRNDAQANVLFSLTFLLGIGAGLLLSLLMLFFSKPFIGAIAGSDPALGQLAYDYVQPLAILPPIMIFTMGMAQFIRAEGSPGLSAMVAIVANAINLVLTFVLIEYRGMGIAASGIGIVVGYVASILVVLPYIFSKKRTFRLCAIRRQDVHEAGEIIKVGLPQALQMGMSFLRALLLNGLVVLWLGSLGMSAMAVCLNMMMITDIFVGGISDSLFSILGTLFGERDNLGIKSAFRASAIILLLFSSLIMVGLIVFSVPVAGAFGIRTAEGLAVVSPALKMYALSLPFYAINGLLQVHYQTTGREKLASVIAVLQNFVLVSIFALILGQLNHQLFWLAFALAGCGTFLFVLLAARRLEEKQGASKLLLLDDSIHFGEILNITMKGSVESAVRLSDYVISLCEEGGLDSGLSTKLGIAVEEMVSNIALYSHKGSRRACDIDIIIRSAGEHGVVLSLRDDGVEFDPTTYQPEETGMFSINGINLVKSIAESIVYSRQLGFNSTLISFGKSER